MQGTYIMALEPLAWWLVSDPCKSHAKNVLPVLHRIGSGLVSNPFAGTWLAPTCLDMKLNLRV